MADRLNSAGARPLNTAYGSTGAPCIYEAFRCEDADAADG